MTPTDAIATSPLPSPVRAPYVKAVRIWLLLCVAFIAVMVAVGGYTRLSGSGLSITEWAPIHGTIPPINAAEWQEEFDAYRQSPQYAQVNRGMSMQEFRDIFWPEYTHRLLGRILGVLFLLPFLYFCARRTFTPRYAGRLVLIFTLGGAQGLIGWLMVKRPRPWPLCQPR